jgi:CubicO group peptidase (beta-lactamase class C family)
MAKPVATMAIGRALQLGHIRSVDQPVADYVREWRRDPQKRRISIRHLLEMRSGLLPQDFGADAPAVLDRAYLHPRHDSVLVHEYPLTDEPGARCEYSIPNSELIALDIERATGQRYANFIGEQLLMPIGAAGGTVRLDRDRGLAHSGCCLSLPAQSWMRLGLLLLEGGMHQGKRLLPADFVRDMKTGTAQNPHFGMGLWVAGPYLARRGYLRPGQPLGAVLHSEPYLDADISLFDGNGHQVMYLVPSQQMIILRMGEFPKTGLEWDNSYLPNLLIADAAERAHRDLPMPQSREIRQ